MKDAKFIDVLGVRTRYFEAGDGEPMLLFHGGDYSSTSNATVWGPAYDSLARKFHVYALDRLGQGFTDLPKETQIMSSELPFNTPMNFWNVWVSIRPTW